MRDAAAGKFPRHGPRQMRDMSSMVRPMHQTSHVVPSKLANIADRDVDDIPEYHWRDDTKLVYACFERLVGLPHVGRGSPIWPNEDRAYLPHLSQSLTEHGYFRT